MDIVDIENKKILNKIKTLTEPQLFELYSILQCKLLDHNRYKGAKYTEALINIMADINKILKNIKIDERRKKLLK